MKIDYWMHYQSDPKGTKVVWQEYKADDVAVIVRCKDCNYAEDLKPGRCYCGNFAINVSENGFCYCGERADK